MGFDTIEINLVEIHILPKFSCLMVTKSQEVSSQCMHAMSACARFVSLAGREVTQKFVLVGWVLSDY